MTSGVRSIRSVKDEIRVLAIKDVPPGDPSSPLWVVGVVFRGGYWLDGVMRTQIPFEEIDATQSLVGMVRGSPHYDQIRVIMLDNVILGGRKVVDIHELHEKTMKPVIVLMSRRPSSEELLGMYRESPEGDWMSKILEAMGEGIELRSEGRKQGFMWIAGLSSRIAERIVRRTTRDGAMPEALRLAELISSAFHMIVEKQKL